MTQKAEVVQIGPFLNIRNRKMLARRTPRSAIVTDHFTERCVLCMEDTRVPAMIPIDDSRRNGRYDHDLEGQLCENCRCCD